MIRDNLLNEDNGATYCPEDNKLRLYFPDRIPRDEFLALRSEGWKATPKQDCAFVTTWTPERRDTCESYAGIIGDEDQSPEERAADRAERFAGYRDKRRNEATGHADTYDSGPSVFSGENKGKAAKAADRHDRHATRACDAWGKAEYWTRRTAGVISHALYSSSPGLRRARITKIEKEIAKRDRETTPQEKNGKPVTYKSEEDGEIFFWCTPGGRGGSWVSEKRLPSLRAWAEDWINHLSLRLAYEVQMIDGDGGHMTSEEVEVAGFLAGSQIWQVVKSPTTGKAVSVKIREGGKLRTVNVERLGAGEYTAPTDEDRANFAEAKAIHTAKTRAENKSKPKLINPTPEDAATLQAAFNEGSEKKSEVVEMSQAKFSHLRTGSGWVATIEIGERLRPQNRRGAYQGSTVAKVRVATGGSFSSPYQVIVLTDKPQKPLPFDRAEEVRNAHLCENDLFERMDELATAKDTHESSGLTPTPEQWTLLQSAAFNGWVSLNQRGGYGAASWTDKGHKHHVEHYAAMRDK